MAEKRLCDDCWFSYEVGHSRYCRINADALCRTTNPNGLCTEFEPRRSLMRRSPEAAGAAAVGLGAGVVELLHWIGGLL